MSNDSFKYTPSDQLESDRRTLKEERRQQKQARKALENAQLITLSKATWGPWSSLFYALIVYFSAQLIASLMVIAYPHLRGWNAVQTKNWIDTTIIAQFWFVLLTEALTFVAIWWFIRYRGSKLRTIGWQLPKLKDPGYAVLGFAIYFAVYALLLAIATSVFPSLNAEQKQDLGFTNVVTGSGLALTFISLVILPPLVEETVFRGFVYSGLRNKLKPILAAVGTSALFAVAHLQLGSGKPLLWVAALDTFCLSLVLCYLREKTDSLWPGILLHALKNGIAFVSLFLIAAH